MEEIYPISNAEATMAKITGCLGSARFGFHTGFKFINGQPKEHVYDDDKVKYIFGRDQSGEHFWVRPFIDRK